MGEAVGAQTLWAMHPSALAELQQRDAIEGMMPEGVRSFLGMAKGSAEAPKPVDPIREGATIIIPINGVLSPAGSYWGGTSTERLVSQLNAAAADDRVGAIVLKIMSPGGLVWGTAEAGDAVFDARSRKPVVAVADKYAFSAAHWIATQASAFYATPSAQVGSVGVRGGHVDMSEFYEGKLGIKHTLIASDAKKVAGHPYAPLSDDDREEMQAEIDEMNQAFVAAIARGRGLKASDVPALHGTGQVFSAQRAAKAGIIDGVMTLQQVVEKYATPRARLDLQRKRAALQAQVASI